MRPRLLTWMGWTAWCVVSGCSQPWNTEKGHAIDESTPHVDGIALPLRADTALVVTESPRLSTPYEVNARESEPLLPSLAASAQNPEDEQGVVDSPSLASSVASPSPATPRSESAVTAAAPSFSEVTLPPLDPERVLVSTAWQTFIYAEPSSRAKKLGYLRSGAVVARAAEPSGFHGCKGGFYALEAKGYVCAGNTASVDVDHPAASLIARAPHRDRDLPYTYARTDRAPPHLYHRLPSREERSSAEGRAPLSRPAFDFPEAQGNELPAFLQGTSPTLRSDGTPRTELVLSSGPAVPRSSFALVHLFTHDDQTWGLTPDLSLLPLDRMQPVSPSTFQGVVIDEAHPMPLVFVRERHATLYSGQPRRGLRVNRRIEYREAFSLSGQHVDAHGRRYLETTEGDWLIDSTFVVPVEARRPAPHWAKPGRSWIDVSLRRQTLVAYEGSTPVYATLISAGTGSWDDPEATHATVTGRFLIHTKHVTDTMSSDAEGDTYDLRDVPYVQFFKDGYALHAAHWHDAFGAPKSHGCINLSPADARWIFDWTDPVVPLGWHGAMSLLDGTLVNIEP